MSIDDDLIYPLLEQPRAGQLSAHETEPQDD